MRTDIPGYVIEDNYQVSGRYSWNEGQTVLSLTSDFGTINLHKEMIDGQEALVNKTRPEDRVYKEGWILIRSKHAILESPLVP